MKNITLPTTLIALAMLPASAVAHPITFGHRLDHEPSNSAPGHNCAEDGTDDPTPACVRIANDGDQGGAVPAGIAAPRNGVIKKFKVRAGAPGELTFVIVKRNGDFAKVVKTGPTVQVQGLGFEELESNAVETFPGGGIKIKKGQYVGIRSTATSALYCSHGGPSQLIYSGLGADYMSPTTDDGCELLVGAVLRKKQ
jgi:hypothetical protein